MQKSASVFTDKKIGAFILMWHGNQNLNNERTEKRAASCRYVPAACASSNQVATKAAGGVSVQPGRARNLQRASDE